MGIGPAGQQPAQAHGTERLVLLLLQGRQLTVDGAPPMLVLPAAFISRLHAGAQDAPLPHDPHEIVEGGRVQIAGQLAAAESAAAHPHQIAGGELAQNLVYPGFSVITGETGAGKSIILGAIGLLLGNRADSKAIKAGRDRCVIEAHFDLSRYGMQKFFDDNDIDYDADDTIIRRELTAAGKSRAFINDTPVPLTRMRELGEQLVDIHSQHQNLLLQKEDFQLNVVDIIAQDADQLKVYQKEYYAYRKAKELLEELKAEIAKSRENEEFMRFQHKELDDANLQEGELEQLEQEAETLSHSEDIKTALFEADNALSGDDDSILDKLKNATHHLENICDVYPSMADVAGRMQSSYIELKDIAQEISSSVDHVEFDPNRFFFIYTGMY